MNERNIPSGSQGVQNKERIIALEKHIEALTETNNKQEVRIEALETAVRNLVGGVTGLW